MRLKPLALVVLFGLWSAPAVAVTEGDFQLDNAQALVDLCSVGMDDPLQVEATYMCLGFVTGAIHYHRALTAGPDEEPIVCPGEPQPTRNDLIRVFVNWAQANPQYMQEPAVEALARAAVAEWPCPE